MTGDRSDELAELMLTLPGVAVLREDNDGRPVEEPAVDSVSVPFEQAARARELLAQAGFTRLEESSLECQVYTGAHPVIVRASQVPQVDLLVVVARVLMQWRTQMDPEVIAVAGGPVTLDDLADLPWQDPVRLRARNRLQDSVRSVLGQCPFGALPAPSEVEHTAAVLLDDSLSTPGASLAVITHEVLSFAPLVESAVRLTPVRVTTRTAQSRNSRIV